MLLRNTPVYISALPVFYESGQALKIKRMYACSPRNTLPGGNLQRINNSYPSKNRNTSNTLSTHLHCTNGSWISPSLQPHSPAPLIHVIQRILIYRPKCQMDYIFSIVTLGIFFFSHSFIKQKMSYSFEMTRGRVDDQNFNFRVKRSFKCVRWHHPLRQSW